MKLFIVTVIFLLPATAFSQNNPMPRHWEEISFDQHRRVLVMYGGGEPDIKGANTKFLNNTFEWDGKKWVSLQSTGPAGITGHVLLYNPTEKLTFLIGGPINQPDDGESLGVWIWDGKVWKQVNKNCPLRSIEGAYDPANNRILVYGKVYEKSNPGANSGKWELWELKANTWKKISDKGPVFTSSFSPYEVSFDIKRSALVLPFWENGRTIVWEYKEEKWKKVDCYGNCPQVFNYYALAYHEEQAVTYLFSGNGSNGFVNDFWKWNGIQWEKIETDKLPVPRAGAKMEYDNGSLYLYGGLTAWGLTNELWRWKNSQWKLLNNEYAMDANRKSDTLKYLITIYPMDAGLFREYGKVLGVKKQYNESEGAYQKAISLDSLNSNYLFELLQLLYEQNKVTEAEGYISGLISSGGKSRDFYSGLGAELISLKKYEISILVFEKANEMQPNGEDYYNTACAFSKLNKKDKAIESLKKAIENGFNSKQQFENDPDLEPLKSDVRWNGLLEKLK